ncbi:MAG: Hsp20/alpha crystallin family protein [Candidatus Heimdallarchaeota archaeon]
MTNEESPNDKKEVRSTRGFDMMTRRLFEMFEDLRTRMDFAFDRFAGKRWPLLEPLRDFEHSHLRPLWTIKEDPNTLTITVDLPYIKKENIKLQAEEDALTVTAELEHSIKFESGFKHHQETEFRRYNQTFRLPCKIDVEDVKASFQQGILSIKAPRKCKRRNIPIE